MYCYKHRVKLPSEPHIICNSYEYKDGLNNDPGRDVFSENVKFMTDPSMLYQASPFNADDIDRGEKLAWFKDLEIWDGQLPDGQSC